MRDASVIEKGVKEPEISTVATDVKIVSWDSPSDPLNPMNWSQKRKWATAILTSLGGLVTLMSGAMLAPALGVIGHDLKISEAEASLALSIYILAFAFGPMVLAPLSEVFGRRLVWIGGSACYVLWNALCGVSNNRGLMITGRFMAGIGASAEFAVSRPIMNDCWSADERGKSFAISAFIPLLGPAIGPILGGLMVQEVNWRWLFYVLSIFDTFILILFIFFLPETHAQTILSRKAAALRKETGEAYYTPENLVSPRITERLKVGLVRPFRLLFTQPVIQVVALILAIQFGLLYIVHSTFATLWTTRYKQTPAMSGLHYIAIVIGCTIGSVVGGWATDRVWARLKKKHEGWTRPENRVPLIVPGAIMMPIGLLWYGWAAEQKLHWIVPDVGIAIFGCGYIVGGTAAQAYIVEAFLDHTASAGAATQLLRNVFAFAFPIWGPTLYSRLGYGWGDTVMAVIGICFGIPGPFILWKYGEKLRAKGK
ncbi:major facilitator superfamily transporter, partial [Melanomma pulvis-pyrius CBS 109.77]